MHVRDQQPGKKLKLSGLLVAFLFTSVFGFAFLFAGTPTNAQGTDPVVGPATTISAGANVVSTTKIVQTTVWDTIKIALANTAAMALLNASNYFLQRVAYDVANHIATGGKGQKPLFTTKGIGEELASVGKDAAGEALGTITETSGLGALGIDLCAPTNPLLSLNIKLGYIGSVSQPRPKCSWSQISSNWNQFTSQSSDDVLRQVGVQFSEDRQTPLGAALQFNRQSLDLVSDKRNAAIISYQTNQGFKDVVGKISGEVKTPAAVVQQELKDTGKLAKDQQAKDVMITGDAFKAGAYGVLGAAVKTFTNTLAEKLMKRVFEKGLISVSNLFSGGSANNPLTNPNAIATGGKASADLANADLLAPKIFSTTNYDALLDFTSCPEGSAKGQNNCVMDNQFYAAVGRAAENAPVTLQQSIELGLINGGWRLLPLSHPKNADRNCYQESFCYSNLVKMRAARIIPIGWELAANSPYNDLNSPVTLKEAMDRFNDCPFVTDANGNQHVDDAKLPDPLHPWCRMVDPNWVLKYPKSICRQKGPGPQLLDSSANSRAQICVDAASCINEDSNGNCTAGYGYCVRERSAWKIEADSCQAQNASCQALSRADGQNFSFLLNTVKAGPCNGDNAGCTARSTVANAVPNSGFEDVIDDKPRDWTTTGASGVDVTGSNAYRGTNAGFVDSGRLDTTAGVLPGKPYLLSLSAKADRSVLGTARAVINVTFVDKNGNTVNKLLVQNCVASAATGSVSTNVALTNLGYQTVSCTITAPDTAYMARVSITSQNADGARTFVDEIGLYGDSFSASPLDAAFLNAKAETCGQNNVGCRTLVRATSAALNLVRNSGFEERTVNGKLPTFWNGVSEADYKGDVQAGFEGGGAVSLPVGSISQDVRGVLANATYTFSVYSKTENGSATGDVGVYPRTAEATERGLNLCTDTGGGLLALKNGATYNRSTCTFTAPDKAVSFAIIIDKNSGSGDLLVDALQLELGVTATSYHDGYSSNAQQIHLKVAPDGLNCTGASTDPSACANFAKSCRREDVGCSLYSPTDGSTPLPAVATAADACPAVCSGYEAYREEPSNFNSELFPVPFIPATATQCAAKEAGCQEFTNLGKLATGGEAREYFTGIRLCQKPDDQTTTYYTWEGNDLKGFQLRVWTLRQSQIPSGAGPADPTGGTAPCTNLGYDTQNNPVCRDTAATVFSCNKDQLKFNPDCREFYDAVGNIHYRLYSHTVLAADTCTEYRMTSATETDCKAHGGLWIRNECHYFGYAPENITCQAAANNCRAYTGNASRNIRIALNDTFEDGTNGNWSPSSGASSSNEAVTASGKSLKVTTGTITKPLYKDGTFLVNKGKSYLMAFWAKGTGDLTPAINASGQTKSFSPVALTTDWRQYVVGPVILDVTPDQAATLQMNFSPAASSGRPAFLDNVELREIADSIYVIKGSWKTPAVCDQDPNGNAAPQYMLGCKTYRDQAGATSTQKSFSRLCQQQAVGCNAFYDTHNSVSPFPETWNAVCKLSSVCNLAVGCPCAVPVNTPAVVCTARRGDSTCYYNVNDAVADANISSGGDTVRIKSDTLSYLIEDRKYQCDATNIGCTATAKPIRDPDQKVVTGWEVSYLKNNPATYATTLCTQPENSCQAWTRVEDGTPVYFKDPGSRTCAFRSDVNVNGNKVSGWFKPDSDEPCYPDYLQAGSSYGIWKNSDAKYDNWVGECDPSQSQCKEFLDPTDASPDFPQGRPYYFIKNEKLDVKSCVGQVSRTRAPSGTNVASACALFKQTDNVTATFDAPRTYDLSEKQFGALVSPIDNTVIDHASGNTNKGKGLDACGNSVVDGGEECDFGDSNGAGLGCSNVCLFENNANIIIRATRDRQCAAWLDCRSSESVFNPSTGAFQNVCSSFGLCAEYRKVGDATRCVKYVDSSYKNTVLDAKIYASRDIGWGSWEFSGDSVPFRYPLDQLKTVVIPDKTVSPPRNDPRLVFASGACPNQNDFTACGSANNLGNRGTCIQGQCVWPIDGGKAVESLSDLQQTSAKNAYPAAACRIYPREDSPFPGTVADPSGWDYSASEINGGNPRLISPKSAFNGANVCQRRVVKVGNNDSITYDSCECGYIQASYGVAVKKYFPLNGPDIPNGYCQDGKYENFECDPTAIGLRTGSNLSCCSKVSDPDPVTGARDCEDDSACKGISKTEYLVGYQGQCVERDFATPINGRSDEFACANWRPTSIVGGTFDIYNLNRTAGYFAPIDRRFYCAQPQPTIATMNGIEIGSSINMGISSGEQNGALSYTHRVCLNAGGSIQTPITSCWTVADCPSTSAGCGPAGACQAPAQGKRCTNNINQGCSLNSDCNGGTCQFVTGRYCRPGNTDTVNWQSFNIPTAECAGFQVCSNDANRACTQSSDCLNGGTCQNPGFTNCVPPFIPQNLSDQGPLLQPTDHFFGPGKMNLAVPNAMENSQNCEGAADPQGAAWCVWPGISTPCIPEAVPGQGSSCPDATSFALRSPVANGIVGCYEVSDGLGNGDHAGEAPMIEWPYIGPPIFRDQMANITFTLANSLYSGDAFGMYTFTDANGNTTQTKGVGMMYPTNPHQNIANGCNDEGGDPNMRVGANGTKTCFIDEKGGWKFNCADSGGTIVFEAIFDKNGYFRTLKLTATDTDDEGSFGIKAVAINFKTACDQVARVDEVGSLGLTKADTELVNNYRKFSGIGVTSTRFAQACRPWGAIGSQSQDPLDDPNNIDVPTRWTSVALIPKDPKNPSQEIVVDQCTENSFRQASTYVLPNSTFKPPGTFGQFLSTLFHRLAKGWKFTPWSVANVDLGGKALTQPYSALASPSSPTLPFFEDVSAPPYAPQVASVDTSKCGSDGICPVKNMNTVAINGHDSGVLTGQDGIFPANMQFYAWASHNSMPVRSRTVVWGDLLPSEPGAEGWYKNHKPYCSPDESDKNAVKECDLLRGLTCRTDTDCPNSSCNATAVAHFGNTPGACDTTPYKFDHIFTCTADDLTSLSANGACTLDPLTDRALNAPCIRRDAITGDVPTCVYKPRVQIVDNWGRCNCSGSNCPVGGFLQSTNPATNQCNLDAFVRGNDPRPWTSFNGEIRVFPNAQDAQAFKTNSSNTAANAAAASNTFNACSNDAQCSNGVCEQGQCHVTCNDVQLCSGGLACVGRANGLGQYCR